jgi:hypothetical protein
MDGYFSDGIEHFLKRSDGGKLEIVRKEHGCQY